MKYYCVSEYQKIWGGIRIWTERITTTTRITKGGQESDCCHKILSWTIVEMFNESLSCQRLTANQDDKIGYPRGTGINFRAFYLS